MKLPLKRHNLSDGMRPSDDGTGDWVCSEDVAELEAEFKRLADVAVLWGQACAKVQDAVQRRNRGLGGEDVFDLLTRELASKEAELERLRRHSACIACSNYLDECLCAWNKRGDK